MALVFYTPEQMFVLDRRKNSSPDEDAVRVIPIEGKELSYDGAGPLVPTHVLLFDEPAYVRRGEIYLTNRIQNKSVIMLNDLQKTMEQFAFKVAAIVCGRSGVLLLTTSPTGGMSVDLRRGENVVINLGINGENRAYNTEAELDGKITSLRQLYHDNLQAKTAHHIQF